LKRIKVIDKESTVILTKTFSDEVPDGALIAAAKATTNDV
jgi:hypothetical protein